jgi:hypothetical protein
MILLAFLEAVYELIQQLHSHFDATYVIIFAIKGGGNSKKSLVHREIPCKDTTLFSKKKIFRNIVTKKILNEIIFFINTCLNT